MVDSQDEIDPHSSSQEFEEVVTTGEKVKPFPWLEYAAKSRQSADTPYIVGFYQDDAGVVQEIYGQKQFLSKRAVVSHNFLLGPERSEYREVSLLEGTFKEVSGPEILRSSYWNLLPEDLRQKFEGGKILITTGNDFYNSKVRSGKHNRVTTEVDPLKLQSHMREVLGDDIKYFLLYYSDGQEGGRTGVIMRFAEGTLKPLVVSVAGKEFVIEVKGCGMHTGGFGKMHHRTGRDIITGGAEREQAINEFYRLGDDIRDDSPKPAGSILFNNEGYEQGYIIRLTPSTVRASYTGEESYPPIDKPEYVRKILDMYASELVDQIFSETPKILDRSSHAENLLLWGNGRFTFTDFSDHVAFADKQYPHEERQGGYMTPKQMLVYCIQMVEEISGYTSVRDQGYFIDSLVKAFKNRGIAIDLNSSLDVEGVADKIWQSGMAYQVFKARRQGEFIGEGVLKEIHDEQAGAYYQEKLSLESVDSFVEKFNSTCRELTKLMEIFKKTSPNTQQVQLIDQLVRSINAGNIIPGYSILDQILDHMYLSKELLLSEEERDAINDNLFYFACLHTTLIEPVERYLAHELDVVVSAKVGCPPEEKEALVDAEAEIRRKLEQLTTIVNGDKANLYTKMTNLDEVRNLIGLSFYGH